MSKKLKPKKDSLIALTRKYANDNAQCVQFFFNIKWPEGFVCEKCGCTHYYFVESRKAYQCKECKKQHFLLAGTIFQDTKLDLYKLILGMFIFFTSNKGVSAIELASELDVNYKTALLLAKKCRILMAQSCSEKMLDSMFYEADVVYIGSKSNDENHQGCATEQQPFLMVLSTNGENKYPQYIKLHPIPVDNKFHIDNIITKSVKLSKKRKMNTDGKTTFNSIKDKINLNQEKILYHEDDHRMYWLNIIVGDIKNNITGIYHGVAKRDLPLFLNEQEWRFNHRYTGTNIMSKVRKYLQLSSPMPRRKIVTVLNLAESYFSSTCV